MTAPVTGTCGPCGAEGVPVVRTARFSDWSEVWQCYDVESCWAGVQCPRTARARRARKNDRPVRYDSTD